MWGKNTQSNPEKSGGSKNGQTPFTVNISPEIQEKLREREFHRAQKQYERTHSKAPPPPIVNEPEIQERVLGETRPGEPSDDNCRDRQTLTGAGGIENLHLTEEELHFITNPTSSSFRPISPSPHEENPEVQRQTANDQERPCSVAGSATGREVANILRSRTPYIDFPPPVDMTWRPASSRSIAPPEEHDKQGTDLRVASGTNPQEGLEREGEQAPTFLATLNDQNDHRIGNGAGSSNGSVGATKFKYDDLGWPIIEWFTKPVQPALPSLSNYLDQTLAQDFPESLNGEGPTRSDLNRLGLAVRGNCDRARQEVDLRVNEIGLRTGSACQKFSQEMRELCDRRLQETRATLAKYEDRALKRERDHEEQEKHSHKLADQVMTSMRTILDVNNRNFGLYEDNMSMLTQHGQHILQRVGYRTRKGHSTRSGPTRTGPTRLCD